MLVRVLTRDNEQQARLAEAALVRAETVAVALPTLSELVWVLSRLNRSEPAHIAMAIPVLISGQGVVIDGPAVDEGLETLDAGRACKGRRLGGEIFVSFDREAVTLVTIRKEAASLLV